MIFLVLVYQFWVSFTLAYNESCSVHFPDLPKNSNTFLKCLNYDQSILPMNQPIMVYFGVTTNDVQKLATVTKEIMLRRRKVWLWKDERFVFPESKEEIELRGNAHLWKPEIKISELDEEKEYSSMVTINTVSFIKYLFPMMISVIDKIRLMDK